MKHKGALILFGLIFVLIILGQGAFVDREQMDHTKCKESFIEYMLFNECTLLERYRDQ